MVYDPKPKDDQQTAIILRETDTESKRWANSKFVILTKLLFLAGSLMCLDPVC